MPEYSCTYYNPTGMSQDHHLGDPIGAPTPIKAAVEYLTVMGMYSDVDDDPITHVYVQELGCKHVYGYEVEEDRLGLKSIEGEFPPPGRCKNTLDMFGGR